MKSLYRGRVNQDNAREVEQYNAYQNFQQSKGSEAEEQVEELTEEERHLEGSLEKAQIIIDTARDEAEIIFQKAHDEGYKKGENEGYEEGFRKASEENKLRYDEEIAKLQSTIKDYIQDVEIEKEKLLEQYVDDLKSIALAIGEKIVQISLKSSGDVVERMILSATEKLKKCAWAKIYIGHNSEKTEVFGDQQFLKELSKLSDNVKIVLMEDTGPGTCIVELPDEIIDISVGTQLENIKEILNNARV